MTFTQQLWQANVEIYQTIEQHPFNQQLALGTLKQNIFQHYMIQDAHYLTMYGRALALASAKAYHTEDMLQFIKNAQVAVIFEKELHENFMKQHNITADIFEQTPLSLACHHYCSFIQATAWAESYPIVLSALLPCFWIYAMLGKNLKSVKNNPYQSWIDTYTEPLFLQAVEDMMQRVDRVATTCDQHTLAQMHIHFKWGMTLEHQFWDSAFKAQA